MRPVGPANTRASGLISICLFRHRRASRMIDTAVVHMVMMSSRMESSRIGRLDHWMKSQRTKIAPTMIAKNIFVVWYRRNRCGGNHRRCSSYLVMAMSSNKKKQHQLVDVTMRIYRSKSDLSPSLRGVAYSLQFGNVFRSCDRLK